MSPETANLLITGISPSVKLIKDMGALSFDYLPPELPHRESQLNALRALFVNVLEGGSQNAILQGRVGTGKTASARLFAEELVKKMAGKGRILRYVHVNCRSRSTAHAVLFQITRGFDRNFPGRGFSEDEMLTTIQGKMETEKSHLLLVLDELDYLLQRSGSELIYKLTRFSEYTGKGQNISVIGISQRDALFFMDEASRSTFKRSNVIRYPAYTASELTDILEQRAALAFYGGAVKMDAVKLIAGHSSREGDARQAIELLEKAGLIAESEDADYVGAEHARKALSEVSAPVDERVIESMGKHESMALIAIMRLLRDRDECSTGEAEEEYRAVCEEFGEKARAHTQFWKYLNRLEMEGLISAETVAEKGRTKKISSELPAEEVLNILYGRLGR